MQPDSSEINYFAALLWLNIATTEVSNALETGAKSLERLAKALEEVSKAGEKVDKRDEDPSKPK
jgi:hypothetical protein